ncbi:DNA-processing protein DprA [Gulosibacter hominis]|uniref:DNA-processing protein DprA n=1 Tax=Gulosibacter hominis TaxID=2770504 RepID=UPI00191B7BBF|nr:DNA-processing protein DprA [Gulosibacter hominis]
MPAQTRQSHTDAFLRDADPILAAAQPLLVPLRTQLQAVDPAALLARVCWSGICEPGDRAAGALIASLGPEAIFPLLAGHDGVVVEALSEYQLHDEHDWPAAFARWRPRLHPERIYAALRNAAQVNATVVVPGDVAWPKGLDALGESQPHALWVRGQLAALAGCEQSVAIVGARAASNYGVETTADLTAGLSDQRCTIVSGGAYGIDAAAHRTAIASDAPTVAVLAGGVDRLYPAAHRGLFTQIIGSGAVISELIVGQAPERWRFIQRNRIIAALAAVTVVVEAGRRSGALHTARSALEIGRAVGAVPGPIHSAASAGCHQLIRDGLAQLVTGTDDIMQLWRESTGLGWCSPELQLDIDEPPATSQRSDYARLATAHSDAARRIYDALRPRSAKPPEALAAHAGMSMNEVRAALVELEMGGLAVPCDTGWRRGEQRH